MMMTALKGFFSNGVEIVNQDNMPKDGPVIIVGNHMNQFVDGMVMMKTAGRPVSFIMAEKSLHKPVVGPVARALHVVPVVRPQDKAVPGQGLVIGIDIETCKIYTRNGNLLDDCAQPGCSVAIKGVGQVVVASVESDDELTFKPPPEDSSLKLENLSTEGMSFKVVPKIPQHELFEKVFDKLRNGGTIGIFPEGGSHDNSTLLPLKAGVAVMALGARAQGIPVRIVAAGINYLGGHHYRSNCFVDVAPPLEVDDELVDQYTNGDKVAAGNALLEKINNQLESVLFHAPTYKELKALRIARRMYQNNIKLTSEEYVSLGTRFSHAYTVWRSDPEFQRLLHDIHLYAKFAWAQGLTDKQVAELPPLGSCSTLLRAWMNLLATFAMCIFVLPFILPGLVLAAPIPLRLRCTVKREMAKALAGSSVKIAARDVAASQVVMQSVVMIPTLMLVYTVLGLLLMFFLWPYKDTDTGVWHDFFVSSAWWLVPLLFLVLFPVYTFYVCVGLSEVLTRRLRHVPSYWLAITSSCKRRHRNPAEMLRQDRKRLVLRVQTFVEEHINQIPQWAANRVISPSEIRDRRSQNTLRLLESGDLEPSISGDGLGVSTKTLVSLEVLEEEDEEPDLESPVAKEL
ncbi:Glycerol-3-phosphate O-acyltransferase 1 [Hondaea fermentalgiana]|uniref:Glycerol-3-phosphate O-acyltransferase 1 n=1 Tax=Hondaea fermentalgiana TaxID=2315210 RepID=A0A2R5G7A4_9STRA|nr:Glycerol-3-phosphate O-acyltransferase 1 [Hondaea fermentalgiana]|eukprot:GBG23921.1 Glycerol-3-phosphate O-acyltransferase 1 [Hondaea fermentalgiana]